MEPVTQNPDAEEDIAATPEAQAIAVDGSPAALVDDIDLPPDAEAIEDYRYDDLEYDADVVMMPGGHEVTLRGLCQAATIRMKLTGPAAWNALDMPVRQDAVAEEFVALSDLLMKGAMQSMTLQIVPPAPAVHNLDDARKLPLQPECTVATRVEHLPGTVVRFKEPDGATMVVVSINGALFKAPADDEAAD
jgi:hypothetical protein